MIAPTSTPSTATLARPSAEPPGPVAPPPVPSTGAPGPAPAVASSLPPPPFWPPSLPFPPSLQDLNRVVRDGGLSKGNPADSPSVRVFQDLIDRGVIQPGDIIVGDDSARPELAPADNVVPGRFTHSAVYVGRNAEGEPETIEAWAQGVISREATWWPRSYNTWAVLRPRRPDGTPATPEDRQKVVAFLQGALGCKYSLDWLSKEVPMPVDRSTTRFYCTQLAWAAWYYPTGIDISPRTDRSWRFLSAVAPEELYESPNVERVAVRFGSPVPEAVGMAAFLAGGTLGATLAAAGTVPLAVLGGPVGGVLSAVAGVTCATAGGLLAKSLVDEAGLVVSDPHCTEALWRGTAFGSPSPGKSVWPPGWPSAGA